MSWELDRFRGTPNDIATRDPSTYSLPFLYGRGRWPWGRVVGTPRHPLPPGRRGLVGLVSGGTRDPDEILDTCVERGGPDLTGQ